LIEGFHVSTGSECGSSVGAMISVGDEVGIKNEDSGADVEELVG
jgi:hypothetical protein